MPLSLIAFENPPRRFAATKIDATVPNGRFFLDFTRKLEVIRWFGVRNRYLGLAVGLLVPVVHEGEKFGGFVFSLNAGELYFMDIRQLWKIHFPSKPEVVCQEADGLKIIVDFATQFPADA